MTRFIGAAFMGLLALSLAVYEWDFGRHTRAREAVVVASFINRRSGVTIADVLYDVNGEQVKATLHAANTHLGPGQKVRVLYQPGNPAEVVLDGFWARHYGSILAFVVCTLLTVAGALDFTEWHRRQVNARLRDDFIDPREATRRLPVLPIDTAPPLWDHELDG